MSELHAGKIDTMTPSNICNWTVGLCYLKGLRLERS